MKPYYQHAGITIYHGDCREILPAMPTVDLIFADPPYGVALDYESHNDRELVSMDWLMICRGLALSVIITPGYVNCFKYPTPDFMAVRFDKTAQSPASIAWMNKWEPIFFYGKPEGRLPWDVIETASQSERRKTPLDHPCPKPISLLVALLKSFKSDSIIDPFCGTGTTLRAAMDLGKVAIGIEIEEKYCEIAAKRLSQEVLGF